MKFCKLLHFFYLKKEKSLCNFLITYIIRYRREARLPTNVSFSGRSMIEMLGVLAIIGVLSIGAITGYNKAMKKYWSNKFYNGTSQLMVNIKTLNLSNLNYNQSGQFYLFGNNDKNSTNILEKLNLIPEPYYYGYVRNSDGQSWYTLTFNLPFWSKQSFWNNMVISSYGKSLWMLFGGLNKELCSLILSYDWQSHGLYQIKISDTVIDSNRNLAIKDISSYCNAEQTQDINLYFYI